MTEAQLQSAIVQAAQLLGWRVHHARPAMTRRGRWVTPIQGDAGFPDLVLLRERILFAELKVGRGRLGVEQEQWVGRLRLAGCEAHVWRPEHWRSGEVEAVLRARGETT